jgi:hypothetical protein
VRNLKYPVRKGIPEIPRKLGMTSIIAVAAMRRLRRPQS